MTRTEYKPAANVQFENGPTPPDDSKATRTDIPDAESTVMLYSVIDGDNRIGTPANRISEQFNSAVPDPDEMRYCSNTAVRSPFTKYNGTLLH